MWMLTTELGAIPSWQPAHFVPYFRKKSSRQNTSLGRKVKRSVGACFFRWKRDLFLTKHFSRRGCAQEAQLRHFACQGWSTTFDKSVFLLTTFDKSVFWNGTTIYKCGRLLSFWTFIVLGGDKEDEKTCLTLRMNLSSISPPQEPHFGIVAETKEVRSKIIKWDGCPFKQFLR